MGEGSTFVPIRKNLGSSAYLNAKDCHSSTFVRVCGFVESKTKINPAVPSKITGSRCEGKLLRSPWTSLDWEGERKKKKKKERLIRMFMTMKLANWQIGKLAIGNRPNFCFFPQRTIFDLWASQGAGKSSSL